MIARGMPNTQLYSTFPLNFSRDALSAHILRLCDAFRGIVFRNGERLSGLAHVLLSRRQPIIMVTNGNAVGKYPRAMQVCFLGLRDLYLCIINSCRQVTDSHNNLQH